MQYLVYKLICPNVNKATYSYRYLANIVSICGVFLVRNDHKGEI